MYAPEGAGESPGTHRSNPVLKDSCNAVRVTRQRTGSRGEKASGRGEQGRGCAGPEPRAGTCQ